MDTKSVLMLMAACLLGVAAASRCPKGQFFDLKLRQCTYCTLCPEDGIVTRSCHGHHDTQCGTYPSFDFLNVKGKEEQKESPMEATATPTMQPPEVTTADENKWYDITMLMIGILVVTCIVILVALIITYVVCRRQHQRKITRDPVFTSALLTDDVTKKGLPLEVITET